jgi:hypothetical protein
MYGYGTSTIFRTAPARWSSHPVDLLEWKHLEVHGDRAVVK